MRQISLKVKLTLLYTFFMLLLTCAALAILFSLSSREVLSSVQSGLEHRVQESGENISVRSGKLRVDSDFYSISHDVYLSLYNEEMYFLYGRLPRGFSAQPELSDGEIQTIREGTMEWYVYDMSVPVSDGEVYYIRGVTSVTGAEESFAVTIRFAVFILPLMVAATAFIGYRFTRRTLLPVRQITRTVREIRADADLSRRIALPEGSGKQRDEIYVLAGTFDDMLSELEQVFEREKRFTSDVSHELRTPVSVILAQCGAMLAEEKLEPEVRMQIELIERKARQMADMISQLLFLSRVDQGRQPLRREPVDISGLTEMAAEDQQMLADTEGRGVRIVCDIRDDIIVEADETLYIRMIVNLISNAVRYSWAGGVVRVSLRVAGGMAEGCVEDHGIGISADALPHIWERFYRADQSRSDRQHSGLGLFMVKWIVQAHGGSVDVRSREGEGSSFMFRLPLTVPDEKNKKKRENEKF